jgi:sialate O-acetylesterase
VALKYVSFPLFHYFERVPFIKVCCDGRQVCETNDTVWQPALASRIEGVSLTISLAVPSHCVSKPINGLRYLWKETPCLFKEAAIYNGEDSDLPAPPYIHYF